MKHQSGAKSLKIQFQKSEQDHTESDRGSFDTILLLIYVVPNPSYSGRLVYYTMIFNLAI
jgi:hypothetical protein